MEPFRRVAQHYETLMRGVDYQMWISYLKLVWAFVGVQPCRVLEIGCGTGRLCRMLAEEGYEVTGIDVSPDMIREANILRETEALEIRFEVQDAADLILGEVYDAAFSFFDSLNNILDSASFSQALARAYAHLRPGGVFLFDLNTAYAFENRMFDLCCLRKSAKVRYDWKSEWDADSRTCTIRMNFWTDGESFYEEHVQRAYSVAEVEAAMVAAGFSDVRFFHAYSLDPVKKTSDRIHILGVRQP